MDELEEEEHGADNMDGEEAVPWQGMAAEEEGKKTGQEKNKNQSTMKS